MINSAERDRLFLRTIWQNRLFEGCALRLTDGTEFEIVSSGIRNDDGVRLPDFAFAAIRFKDSNVTLYGNIKIDVQSSHWREQGSVNAPEFSSVILHVVLAQDVIITQNNREIPTLIMEIPPIVASRYDDLRCGRVCRGYLSSMEEIYRHHILTRVMSDRLKRKSDEILAIFESVHRDWHETAYICFMRAFGFREQKAGFETLARSLPLRFIRLHSDSLPDLEALILGQAGLLDVDSADNYTRRLQDQYTELSRRHDLRPRQISWRGGVVRPCSLPVFSLIRAAVILKDEERFLHRVLSAGCCDDMVAIFDVTLSEYWQNHSGPSRVSSKNSTMMTDLQKRNQIINFVIPFLTAYGIVTADEEMRDKAVGLYEQLPAEDNQHTRHWSNNGGYCAPNAFFSQALIQLRTAYCGDGLCGDCPLGVHQLREVYVKKKSFGT